MRTRLHYRLFTVAALLLFFALALNTAGRKAITTDEPLHLVHSIVMKQTGVMALPEMHVPLTYRLVGGLLRSGGPLPDVTQSPSWPSANPYEIGREYVFGDDLPTNRIIWLGRFVVVLMGMLLGALMGGWTWTLTGRHGPATAILLAHYALSPNLLAAAALLTTDMAATVTWFAAVYTWWRTWRRPGWGRWLLAALALGLALAAKLTGALLLPVTLVLAYVAAWPGRRSASDTSLSRWARPALVWLTLLPVAGLLLWALYGFDSSASLPLHAYWEAWRLLLTEVETGHANFFLGRIAPIGSWLYFPVTLLLKTPPLQLALFLAIPVVLWRALGRGRGQDEQDNLPIAGWRTVTFVALPAVVLLAVVAGSRLNFGYRHALPAMPFLMLLGGLAAAWLWDLPGHARPVARVALTLATTWTVVAGLRTHPDHLTYFNELARGQGWRFLGDSNLDWGQDLNQLGAYASEVQATSGRPLLFSYTGIADRAYYGLPGPSLIERFNAGDGFAAANPPAGRYAINASDLQGTGLILGALDEIDLFDWFRHRQPLTTLGGSIFVYDVAAPKTGEWIAHCDAPGRSLDDGAAEQLVGRAGLRHITFDCRTSWVFPPGPGWYVLPPGERWIDSWLGETQPEVVYRHRANAYGPDFAIAYWGGGGCGEEPTATRRGGLTPASRLPCSPALQLYPGEASGPATLRAYGARGTEWVTGWEVREATTAPLSVRGHLLSTDGTRRVADGLGCTTAQWRPGDWFLQRHLFAAPGHTLETGLYNYVTLENVGPTSTLTVD